MIQEIITYMIIGSAVTIAVIKAVKKFSNKKRIKKVDFKKDSFSLEHNCSDCSAECILRETVKPKFTNSKEVLCKKLV